MNFSLKKERTEVFTVHGGSLLMERKHLACVDALSSGCENAALSAPVLSYQLGGQQEDGRCIFLPRLVTTNSHLFKII